MSRSVVIYPQFLECQNYTLDQYWKEIFYSCACNKFPKGVRYDHSSKTLHIRTQTLGGKVERNSVHLSQSTEEIYKIIIKVFKEVLSLFSSRDLKIKKKELDDLQNKLKVDLDCEWKKLKPRFVKDTMIDNYILELKEKYSLDKEQTIRLLSKVNLGFQLKRITPDDVVYEDKRIKNIKNITRDKVTGEWEFVSKKIVHSKAEKVVNTQKFYQFVDKFVKEINMKKIKL